MNFCRLKSLTIILLACLTLTTLAFARVPQTINYQGYLKDGAGKPVSTATDVTFSLYSTANGTGALWNSTARAGDRVSVTPTDGIYSVELGASPQPALPAFDRQYWLGIQAGNDQEMRPLQALSSVPYAMTAASVADNSITTSSLAINCANGQVLVKTVTGWECGMVCSCPLDQQNCGGTCANLTSDRNNCGACGSACSAGQVCSNSVCSLSCQNGLINCGGVCRDLTADGSNCGGCGIACAAGQVCSSGVCSLSCGGGTTKCGNACINTANDSFNCGGCGNVCAAGQLCNSGLCSLSCAGGSTKCDNVCVNTAGDASNCGGCGNVCAAGQVCGGGSCVTSCQSPMVNCAGQCKDTRYDPTNCGGCGNVCNTTNHACLNSSCI